HDVIRHLGIAANQDRAQDIVDQPDHPGTETDEDQGIHGLTCGKQIERYRQPDQGRTHGRDQGGNGHEDGPQQCTGNAQNPEDEAAQSALHNGYHQVAFDGGAGHFGKQGKQHTLPRVAQRQRAYHQLDQLVAVAQHKKCEIKHEAQVQQKTEGVLADIQGLAGQNLAAAHGSLRRGFLELVEVDPNAVQGMFDAGKGFAEPLDVLGRFDLTALDLLIDANAFVHSGADKKDHRQYHNDHTQQQGQQRGQIASVIEALQQFLLHGIEDDRNGACPENRAKEGAEQPQEAHRHQQQKQYERA